MADTTVDATRRLNVKKQTLDDAYAAPANFLEIDVINPITHGVGKKRYTDYEVRMRVSNIPPLPRTCKNMLNRRIWRVGVFIPPTFLRPRRRIDASNKRNTIVSTD